MVKVIKESPIGDFIRDLLNVLESNEFEEIIWVGMHEWLSYVTRVFWLKGYRFETAITPVDSRWGQDVYEDDAGHKIHITSLDYAKEIGNNAIYLIANDYVDELRKEIVNMGIEESRVFGFKKGTAYHQDANGRLAEMFKEGYKPMTHKELQDVLLDLLKEFARFCEEHGLTYFLDSGTLLGAVRHQGFIPWDNDADVIMPYEDYQKMIELYPRDIRYELIDWTNNDDITLRGHAILSINNAYVHIPSYSMINPVHIDIFPLTGCPGGTKEKASKIMERERLGQKWRECALLSEFGVKDERADIFKEMHKNHIYDCEQIVNGSHTIYNPMDARVAVYNRNCYEKAEKHRFEDTCFSIPVGWDEVLTKCYGSYMNLPLVEARVGYPNKFYWDI